MWLIAKFLDLNRISLLRFSSPEGGFFYIAEWVIRVRNNCFKTIIHYTMKKEIFSVKFRIFEITPMCIFHYNFSFFFLVINFLTIELSSDKIILVLDYLLSDFVNWFHTKATQLIPKIILKNTYIFNCSWGTFAPGSMFFPNIGYIKYWFLVNFSIYLVLLQF